MRSKGMAMRVNVNRAACGGTGMCAELCPDVFGQDPDYIAYVKDGGERVDREGGVLVPEELRDAVLESVDACPTSAVVLGD
jgi:ferredoxin